MLILMVLITIIYTSPTQLSNITWEDATRVSHLAEGTGTKLIIYWSGGNWSESPTQGNIRWQRVGSHSGRSHCQASDQTRHTKDWVRLTLGTVWRKMGVSSVVANLLRDLYKEQEAAVKSREQPHWFTIRKGVQQDCLVSSMCFYFYSEDVMRRSVDEFCWIVVNIGCLWMNSLRFADDIMLISRSPAGLQILLDEADRVSRIPVGNQLMQDEGYGSYEDEGEGYGQSS